MLRRKLYYLTPYLKPRITFMRPSLSAEHNPVISFTKALVLCAAILSLTPSVRAQSAFEPEPNLTVAEQYLLAAANEARSNQGLPPVHLDPVLTEASAAHAREMADHADISHQSNGEAGLADRGATAGAHFSLTTENVGEAP